MGGPRGRAWTGLAQSAFVRPLGRPGLVEAARKPRWERGGGRRRRPGKPSAGWVTRAAPPPRSPAPADGMAAIPSSGSLVATHDYYRRRLGSASSSSSCGSAEYPGEAVPHHPGLPKADPGHWWASFFFGKATVPFMATVLESPEHSESPRAPSGMVTSGLASETTRKQPLSQPSQGNTRPSS